MASEQKIFIEQCGLDLVQLDSPRSLFLHLRDCSPGRTCVIATDSIDWASTYMDILRVLARLAGIGDEVRRVTAERSPVNQEQVELVFYWKGEEFRWRFTQRFRYLSEEFWEMARHFLAERANQNIILISTLGEPFLELVSLPSEDLAKIGHAGLSLSVFVYATQSA